MKRAGNVIAGIGLTGFILGACGYDGSSAVCGVAVIAGLGLLFFGYRLSGEYADYEDIIEDKKR